MDKDLINDYRAIVLPVLQNVLIKKNFEGRGLSDALELEKDFNEILRLAEKALDSQWIPITFRNPNDDEYKEFIERHEDIPREECKVFDCRMPDDGQEVLVTTCGGEVCEDIFCADPDYYGFENCSDPGDAIAWMPKPEPYKKEGTENG